MIVRADTADFSLYSRDFKGTSWRELQRKDACAVTLGNFDGLHLGHQQILKKLLDLSRQQSLEPVVVTFLPHPRHFFKREKLFSLLSTPWEKAHLIKKEGPFTVIFLRFDQEFSSISHQDFLYDFLLKKLGAQAFVLGPDYRFGAGARGNLTFLKDNVADSEKSVRIIPSVTLEEEVISSSRIRELLGHADLKRANELLGHRFFYSGTVIPGDGRGRKLGFPTANLNTHFNQKLLVAPGVYGARAKIGGRTYHALVNVGENPTFGAKKTRIEAHILDLNRDICGQNLTLELNSYLRKEKKFDSATELISQIQLDVNIFKNKLEEKGIKP